MTDIKLIEKDTNISELKMSKMPWDVEVKGVSYQVVRIEGYVHSIGGRHGENNLWMYPRNGSGGNPACRGYDNFIKRHNGNKHILKDCIKDRNGKYHDDIIYEIVNN